MTTPRDKCKQVPVSRNRGSLPARGGIRGRTEHRHSAIRFVTPDDRHFGREAALLAQRHQVYQRARVRHPERWSRDTRDWTPAGPVRLGPSPNLTPAVQEMKRTG